MHVCVCVCGRVNQSRKSKDVLGKLCLHALFLHVGRHQRSLRKLSSALGGRGSARECVSLFYELQKDEGKLCAAAFNSLN